MTKPLTTLASLLSLALSLVGAAAPALAEECPNAALRQGLSKALPDCRAYELVTTDSNHVALGRSPGGRLSVDGSRFGYQTIDAPDHASSASAMNIVVAKRDPVSGWSGASIAPPSTAAVGAFNAEQTFGVSPDLTSVFVNTDQPLTPEPPAGLNHYVGSPERGYQLLDKVGIPFAPVVNVYGGSGSLAWGNADLSKVIFTTTFPQLPIEPLSYDNTYYWSQETGLRLVGILPDGTPVGAGLGGGLLQAASEDGKNILFVSGNVLYLRIDDSSTVELAPLKIIGGNLQASDASGITPDGSKVIFTSFAALTANSNTGPTHEGRDIYSYDVASGHFTDLTPDSNPADPEGAKVGDILATNPDGSTLYFTAAGDLAPGHRPGHLSLYVWHEGRIDFVSDADGIDPNTTASGSSGFGVTPDGRHLLFASTDALTSYHNTDPATNAHVPEVYEATLGAGVVCVSCRVDGTPPTGGSKVPFYRAMGMGKTRVISDDGSRAFFESQDAVVPQASNGLQQVYEYSQGKVLPISRVDGSYEASFMDTNASGDDVFIGTYDELLPNPTGGDQAIYDARVDGGFPTAARETCSGDGCQGAATSAPALPVAATIDLTGSEALQVPPLAGITVAKVKVIVGRGASLRVKVAGRGRLRLAGTGLQTKGSTASKAQTLTVRVLLTGAAAKTLEKRRLYKTTARLTFLDSSGKSSTVIVPLTFTTSSRKGH
jgi:hypothetical protein